MRRKRFAVLLAGVEKEYQQQFTLGMADAARELDADLCVFNCQGFEDGFVRNDQGEGAIFELTDPSQFDGAVLLLATIPGKATRQKIREKLARFPELPVVTIDSPINQSVVITFDDLSSVRKLMEHLLDDHGAKRFALVTGPKENSVSVRRCGEVLRILESRELEIPEDLIFEGRWAREGGVAAADWLLAKEKTLPDVVVCANDDMAFGMIERLTEKGVNVPGQLKITGFDARPEALGRGLTTIRRPVYEAGQLAVSILNDWIANGRPLQETQELPTELIPGWSCGCPEAHEQLTSYVRDLTHEYRVIQKRQIRAAGLFATLAGLDKQTDILDDVAGFARAWGAEEMYLCVDPELLGGRESRKTGAYPECMLQLAGWQNGQVLRRRFYHTGDLAPCLAEPHDEPKALLFSPLYFVDRSMGYMVMDVRSLMGSELYVMLALLAGALSSLSQRATIASYAAEVEKLSMHDTLTGLTNRLGMQKAVGPLFAEAQAQGRCFAVINGDMDCMKFINDRFGHQAGDTAICRMGRVMQTLEEDGLIAIHVSGDEFLAMGIVESPEKAASLADKLRRGVDDINTNDPWLCDIMASVGYYAAVPGPEDTIDQYQILADRSMYEEKSEHRRLGLKPGHSGQ